MTHLVLEQQAQGLDDLLEIHIVGQAAHIVVALDDGGGARAGLDHIGIDGALCQIVHCADLFRLFLKDTDEFFPDDLALALRIGLVRQLCQKTLLCIDTDKIH